MNGSLVRAELRRLWRNKREFLVMAFLPVGFFLAFSSAPAGERIGDLDVPSYLMISMATVGAMMALFTTCADVANERAVGWGRQLRVAGVRGRDYIAAKVLVAYVGATVSVFAVLGVAVAVRDVAMSGAAWITVPASVLVGLVPIASLGVAVGYLVRPHSLRTVLTIGSVLLGVVGGLWNPAEHSPELLVRVMELLPVYWAAAAGRAAYEGEFVGWQGIAVVVVWAGLLTAAAASLYERDSLRPSAAGAT